MGEENKRLLIFTLTYIMSVIALTILFLLIGGIEIIYEPFIIIIIGMAAGLINSMLMDFLRILEKHDN